MGEIATLKKTDALLRLNGLNAKKNFGQNFIINTKVVEDIVKESNISNNATVIEIGPGLGALTEELVKVAKKVIAYEIDKDLVPLLKQEIKADNLEVINEDFLNVDLDVLLNKYKDEEIYFVSNLPYYITSDILKKLFISQGSVKKIITMMQKEVGKRLISPSSNKDKNEITLLCEFCSVPRIIKYVSKNDFLPRPQIDSIVLEFVPKTTEIPTKEYDDVLKLIFANRRKTLANNLQEKYSKEQIEQLLSNLDPNIRAEALSKEQILNLAKKIKEVG